MSDHQFKPGNNSYKEYLDNLSVEDRASHFAAKQAKRSLKKKFDQMIDHNANAWLAHVNTAMMVLLQKAITDKDPQAFNAVADRLLGKPATDNKAEDAVTESDALAEAIKALVGKLPD